MTLDRLVISVALAAALLLPSCQSTEPRRATSDEAPAGYDALKSELAADEPDVRRFAEDGPLAYVEHENIAIKLPTKERLVADLVVPSSDSPTPLVVMVHGNQSHKEAHRYQARRLATFGLTVLVLQVPNRNLWVRNGLTVARLVRHLHDHPLDLEADIDPENIILVGHSFGGSAVTIAAGRGAPVKGVILLDPAVVNGRVKKYMRRVDVPVMLLGADREVFRSRQRRLFYKLVKGEMAEVSVRGATHDDAQNPSMFSLSAFGFDPFTSREKQATFTAAIATTAFGLAATGSLDYAWDAFDDLADRGVLKNPRRRAAHGSAETAAE